MTQTRIMLVDDHRLFREALANLLEIRPGFTVVGSAPNGKEALEILERVTADVLFLDISMPEMGGLIAISQIRKICADTKIIMLTMFDRADYVKEAVSQGAVGYLLKSEPAQDIFRAIEGVMAGKIVLSESVNQLALRTYTSGNGLDRSISVRDRISAREKEVLQLLTEGYTGKEIASKLNISAKTVEHHRSNLLGKLGCRNLAQLIKFAIKEGFVAP